jgi:hypothetical protein
MGALEGDATNAYLMRLSFMKIISALLSFANHVTKFLSPKLVYS